MEGDGLHLPGRPGKPAAKKAGPAGAQDSGQLGPHGAPVLGGGERGERLPGGRPRLHAQHRGRPCLLTRRTAPSRSSRKIGAGTTWNTARSSRRSASAPPGRSASPARKPDFSLPTIAMVDPSSPSTAFSVDRASAPGALNRAAQRQDPPAQRRHLGVRICRCGRFAHTARSGDGPAGADGVRPEPPAGLTRVRVTARAHPSTGLTQWPRGVAPVSQAAVATPRFAGILAFMGHLTLWSSLVAPRSRPGG